MPLKQELFLEIEEYLRRHYSGREDRLYAAMSVSEDALPKAAAPKPAHKSAPKLSFFDRTPRSKKGAARHEDKEPEVTFLPDSLPPMPCGAAAPDLYGDLNDRLNTLDESFQQALLRLIDERGMKDSDCYKRAGVDRKLFSKIRSNPSYRPSKPTVIAFAMALALSLDETADLLCKAGYALSHSAKFDVIVEYFIVSGRYDLQELNMALYEFDQPVI